MHNNQLITYLRVPVEFTDKFPKLTQEKSEKYYNTYLNVLRSHLLRRLPFNTSNYMHLSLSKMFDECSTFNVNKKRYGVWSEFIKLRPFFQVTEEKGNGRKKAINHFEKNSKVYIMNQKLLDLLIDTSDAEELVTMYYGEITDPSELETVQIDIKSLTNYINRTKQEIEKSERNSKHEGKLYRNLRQAKYIKIISEFFYEAYDEYVLPQIPKPSPYGRMYYKGINIQNVSKEVRSACLGDHHSYDLNAAVYAIKLMLVRDILKQDNIDDFGHFTYTKEYLEFKGPIRSKLAEHIKSYPEPIKLVKEAMTSIGFGARIGGGSWNIDGEWHTPALDDILMNRQDRERFMNDPWVIQFVREQQAMTTIITDHFKNTPGFKDKVKDVPNMFKNDKIRKTQIMSYVFQHTEKSIVDLITKDIDVLAKVHDSFITKYPLSIEQLQNIKHTLTSLDPLMSIDHETFGAWVSVEIEDESDIDAAWSKLTGVQHSVKPVKIYHQPTKKQKEGHYTEPCDYGQYEYDPENDPYVQDMNEEQRKEHYRIVGYNPNQLPSFLKDLS